MRKLIVCIIIICVVCVMFFRYYKGYYPLPYGMRAMYYLMLDEKERLTPIIVDERFSISEKGYSVISDFTSPYSIQHILYVNLMGELLPVDYHSEAGIEVEVFRKDKIIFFERIDNILSIKGGSGSESVGTYSLILTKIPFPLGGTSYKDTSIRVTVINPDTNIDKYLPYVRLELFPDIMK